MRLSLKVAISTFLALALLGAGALVALTPGGASASTPGTIGEVAGFSPGAGILWMSDAELDRELDAMAASGARWLRVDFDWPSIQPSRTSWNWSHTDRVVAAANAHGMEVLALPTYTPSWARPSGTTDKHPPSDPANFANFVGAAVRRYAPRGIDAWEIWNEPNIPNFWAPRPDPERYTRLLQAASAAVRAADPDATVIAAGLAPATDENGYVSPLSFVQRMYNAGGRSSFDALAVHPYAFPASPLDASTASWNTFYRLPQIRNFMVSRGDGAKKIWLTEYGAPTGSGDGMVGQTRQAQLIRDGFTAQQQWSWTGPLFVYSYRDAGTNASDREDNFGLVRHDFTAKPAWSALRDVLNNPRRGATTTTTAPPSTTTTTRPPATTTTTAPTASTVGLLPARIAVKVFGRVLYYTAE